MKASLSSSLVPLDLCLKEHPFPLKGFQIITFSYLAGLQKTSFAPASNRLDQKSVAEKLYIRQFTPTGLASDLTRPIRLEGEECDLSGGDMEES